jgi:hypothetical protein
VAPHRRRCLLHRLCDAAYNLSAGRERIGPPDRTVYRSHDPRPNGPTIRRITKAGNAAGRAPVALTLVCSQAIIIRTEDRILPVARVERRDARADITWGSVPRTRAGSSRVGRKGVAWPEVFAASAKRRRSVLIRDRRKLARAPRFSAAPPTRPRERAKVTSPTQFHAAKIKPYARWCNTEVLKAL